MSGVNEIDVPKARELRGQGQRLFVDIRDPDSFSRDHIPGAIHLQREDKTFGSSGFSVGPQEGLQRGRRGA